MKTQRRLSRATAIAVAVASLKPTATIWSLIKRAAAASRRPAWSTAAMTSGGVTHPKSVARHRINMNAAFVMVKA